MLHIPFRIKWTSVSVGEKGHTQCRRDLIAPCKICCIKLSSQTTLGPQLFIYFMVVDISTQTRELSDVPMMENYQHFKGSELI